MNTLLPVARRVSVFIPICLLVWSWGPRAQVRTPGSFGVSVARAESSLPGHLCPTSQSPRPTPVPMTRDQLERGRRRAEGSGAGPFRIEFRPGPRLAANPDVLSIFRRAAAQWEAVIADPVRVVIDADFMPLDGGTLGSTRAVAADADYDLVVEALRADSAVEPDDGVVGLLPTLAEARVRFPRRVESSPTVFVNKATLKALGFEVDGELGESDASITINSRVDFDLDPSDGIGRGQLDLETVVAHEIGHVLGFNSVVDDFDAGFRGPSGPSILDLYRFRNDTPDDPESARDFTLAARSLEAGGDAILDDLDQERRLSTGELGGDGRQASHWKDNDLTGVLIGIMDPTLGTADRIPVGPSDVRALDLIGFDSVASGMSAPTPAPAPGPGPGTPPGGPTRDLDGDGVADAQDNCRFVSNAGQEDRGGVQIGRDGDATLPDGIGDACQCGDVNDDGRVDPLDRTEILRALFQLPANVNVDKCDVGGLEGCGIEDARILALAFQGAGPGVSQLCRAASPR